jgi:hypothetical protein
LDCRHVCRTCAFHDAVQAGKQKDVHPPYSPNLAPAGARSGEYVHRIKFSLRLFEKMLLIWIFERSNYKINSGSW